MTENHNSMDAIVQELRKIKIFTGMTGVALTIMLIFTMLSTLLSIGALALIMPNVLKTQAAMLGKQNTQSFSDQTSELIEQGKLDEASAKISARKETHPNDAYAYYYEAKIHLAQGEPEKALVELDKIRELAPSWNKEYTDPLIELAEKRIAESR